MANANLTLLTTANTFLDEMVQVNNLANAINQLRNGLFFSDNGNITLANGVLIIQDSVGTVLSVSGNATFSQQITTGSIQNQGALTSQGNTATFTSNTVLVQVANTVIAKNLISNTVVTLQNVNAAGYLALSGNNISNVLSPIIGVYNELATLNLNSAFMVSNTGNVFIKKNITVNGTANIASLNVGALAPSTLNAFTIILDPTDSFSAINGNVIVNNLTVQGNQIILGTTILSTDTFQLRSNVAGDGDGHFEVWRGTSINANAQLKFNHTANVWQLTANDAQTFSTVLTSANVLDSITSNSITSVATANAVNAAYASAVANATLITANNGTFVAQRKGLNFLQGPGIALNVATNTANAQLVDVNVSAIALVAGANQQVQFNDAGSSGASPQLTFDKATNKLGVGTEVDIGKTINVGPTVLSGPSSNQSRLSLYGQSGANVLGVANLIVTGTNFQLTGNVNAQIGINTSMIGGSSLTFEDVNNTNTVSFYIDAGSNNTLNTVVSGVTTWNLSSLNITSSANLDINGRSYANSHVDAYSNNGLLSSNTNINCLNGTVFDFTLTGNANLTFQNAATVGNVTTIHVILRQTLGGGTVGWTNTIRWSDNTTPVLSTSANTGDMFQFSTWNGGTIWWGAQVYANVPMANTY
jgi:hypothetical protein